MLRRTKEDICGDGDRQWTDPIWKPWSQCRRSLPTRQGQARPNL